jgi:hypothetical protein
MWNRLGAARKTRCTDFTPRGGRSAHRSPRCTAAPNVSAFTDPVARCGGWVKTGGLRLAYGVAQVSNADARDHRRAARTALRDRAVLRSSFNDVRPRYVNNSFGVIPEAVTRTAVP